LKIDLDLGLAGVYIGGMKTSDTGNAIITARVRAYSGDSVREHSIMVGADETVRVWDPAAGHYTTCHILSPRTQRRLVRRAAVRS